MTNKIGADADDGGGVDTSVVSDDTSSSRRFLRLRLRRHSHSHHSHHHDDDHPNGNRIVTWFSSKFKSKSKSSSSSSTTTMRVLVFTTTTIVFVAALLININYQFKVSLYGQHNHHHKVPHHQGTRLTGSRSRSGPSSSVPESGSTAETAESPPPPPSSSSVRGPKRRVTSSSMMVLHSTTTTTTKTSAATATSITTHENDANKIDTPVPDEDRSYYHHHQQKEQKPSILRQQLNSSPSSSATTILWNDGCYNNSQPQIYPRRFEQQQQNEETQIQTQTQTQPTGIVVTLLATTNDRRVNQETFRRICKVVPTQLEYFIQSQQGLDVLFVVEENQEERWTGESFVSCLRLRLADVDEKQSTQKVWYNLDGTTMTTTSYTFGETTDQSSSTTSATAANSVTIYIAKVQLEHPTYIQQNPMILQQPIVPPSCEAPRQYIQATRWYTREMLHLGILQNYDYFLKVDTDVIFVESIPFNLLYDIDRRGCDHNNHDIVFAHTAQYHPKGSKTCAQGIKNAVDQYIKHKQNQQEQPMLASKEHTTWNRKPCSVSSELSSDVDWYYTNFVVGKVKFWQSPEVLDFATFLSEYPEGFYKHRWTDQIFWHHAMGLFVRDYEKHVMDYTNLRCMPDPNSWYSSYDFNTYGADAWHQCNNGGFFLHPKDYQLPLSRKKKQPLANVAANSSQPLFQSTYTSDCSASQEKKKGQQGQQQQQRRIQKT